MESILIIASTTLKWVAPSLFILALLLIATALWKLVLLISGKGEKKKNLLWTLALLLVGIITIILAAIVYRMGSGIQI